MEQPGGPGRLEVEYCQGVEWWADCYPQWKKNRLPAQPSSQGPCICPDDGVVFDCPRCAYMQDYVGQSPFKDHLRELREVIAQLARDTNIPSQLLDGVSSAKAFRQWQIASGLHGYPEEHGRKQEEVQPQEEGLDQEG